VRGLAYVEAKDDQKEEKGEKDGKNEKDGKSGKSSSSSSLSSCPMCSSPASRYEPVCALQHISGGEECVLLSDDHSTTRLSCEHKFHKECLASWRRLSNDRSEKRCPVCAPRGEHHQPGPVQSAIYQA